MNDDTQTLESVDIDWLLVTAYVYLQNQRYDRVIALIEAALAFDRNNVEALKILSYTYLLTGRYRDTVIVCEKIYDLTVESNNDIAPVYLIQSQALLHLNQKERAREWLLKYQSFVEPNLHA